ncbi:MAG: GNAT family N-acetyltransferase [Pseudomonadota bacterium]
MKVLFTPSAELLPDYSAALERKWSPNNLRPEAWAEQLEQIQKDPARFLAGQSDRAAEGPPVALPDGSTVPRLPSFRRWIFKDGFAGSIGLRWQPGTAALPPTCLGHIGYAVVPWRRRQGLASAALIELLPEAQDVGLLHVDVTTDAHNHASP